MVFKRFLQRLGVFENAFFFYVFQTSPHFAVPAVPEALDISTFFLNPRNTPGFDNPRSVSACVPEAFALSTSLFFFKISVSVVNHENGCGTA